VALIFAFVTTSSGVLRDTPNHAVAKAKITATEQRKVIGSAAPPGCCGVSL
jgi:hypothetical protein